MKIKRLLTFNILVILCCFGCTKPRIEPDFSIYEDRAFIKSFTSFYYKEVTSKLNYDEPVTGYQTISIGNTPTFDNPNRKIDIVLAKTAGSVNTDLTKLGLRFNTDAQRVEPLNGAPTLGLVGDFSKGPYTYRLSSPDGTVRDWTISLTIAP